MTNRKETCDLGRGTQHQEGRERGSLGQQGGGVAFEASSGGEGGPAELRGGGCSQEVALR